MAVFYSCLTWFLQHEELPCVLNAKLVKSVAILQRVLCSDDEEPDLAG